MYPVIFPDTIYKLTETYKKEKKGLENFIKFLQQLLDQYKNKIKENFPNDSEKLRKGTLVDQVIFYETILTSKQIDDHMISFISTFKNVGLQIAHCVLLMAMHPEVQEMAYSEIKEVFPSGDVKIDYESIKNLEYFDRVLKEAMRLLPSIPFVFRRNEEDLELDGQIIPKDSNFFISIFTIHRNKKIWGPDADKFDPDRFLPERIAKVDPSAFLPFLLGRRNCIGKQYSNLSIKIVMKKLIENFTFSTELKLEELYLINDTAILLTEGCLINVTRR
jgi:cytochrome P450